MPNFVRRICCRCARYSPTVFRKACISGLRAGRSTAFSSGSSPETTASRAVPNGTTPRCMSCNISSPGSPLASNGWISALIRPFDSASMRCCQKGFSRRSILADTRQTTHDLQVYRLVGSANGCGPKDGYRHCPRSHRPTCHQPTEMVPAQRLVCLGYHSSIRIDRLSGPGWHGAVPMNTRFQPLPSIYPLPHRQTFEAKVRSGGITV